MGDQIKIDKDLFSKRLSHFYAAWKADKRAGTGQLFGGATSILILMGRTDQASSFQKNNAMHVSWSVALRSFLALEGILTGLCVCACV